jgi:hypothetical protein
MATKEMWTYRGAVRSGVDLSGYEVEAIDGSIGTVDEATNEVGASYLIVDTGPWIFGKSVLLPAGVIERIDTEQERVFAGLTRDEIKNAPEYDPDGDVSTGYRQEVGSYYAVRRVGSDAARRTPARTSRAGSTSQSSGRRGRATRSQAKRSASRGQTNRGRSSGRQSEGPTKEELYEQAKRLDIEGRSKMNKSQLARAIGGKRGGASARATSRGKAKTSQSRRGRSSGSRQAKANPVEVQAFLDGVSYPTRKGDLVREAERSGARREVRSTLERLPEERFGSPTEVSEAIGKLR